MRRDDQRQAVKNISLEQLKSFKNHPFQVRDDEEFRRLVESIEIHGVIHPAVARQIGEDCYELISGHRRKAACEVLGYSEMPVLVRSMTDDEAVVNMVDANLQRETILPSERAFAYKMKLVAMSHQGRKGFTSAQLGRKCVGKESRELIAEQVGQSRNQISRYIRLTELIPEILEMVDNRKMALNPAVSISYLDKKQQKLLYKVMVIHSVSLQMRHLSREVFVACVKTFRIRARPFLASSSQTSVTPSYISSFNTSNWSFSFLRYKSRVPLRTASAAKKYFRWLLKFCLCVGYLSNISAVKSFICSA